MPYKNLRVSPSVKILMRIKNDLSGAVGTNQDREACKQPREPICHSCKNLRGSPLMKILTRMTNELSGTIRINKVCEAWKQPREALCHFQKALPLSWHCFFDTTRHAHYTFICEILDGNEMSANNPGLWHLSNSFLLSISQSHGASTGESTRGLRS